MILKIQIWNLKNGKHRLLAAISRGIAKGLVLPILSKQSSDRLKASLFVSLFNGEKRSNRVAGTEALSL